MHICIQIHEDSPSIERDIVTVPLSTGELDSWCIIIPEQMHRKWLLDVTTLHECVPAHVQHWTTGTEDYVWEVLNKRLVSFTPSCVDLHSCGQFKHDVRITKEITYCPWTSNFIAENKTKQMLIKLLFSKSSAERWYETLRSFHFPYLFLLAWYLQIDTDEKENLMGYLR